MVVRRAMKFSTIVAGGGAIEMEISRFILNYLDIWDNMLELFQEKLN